MKHDQYKELLHLSFYHELSDEEQSVLDGHLKSCGDCRTEAAELGKLGLALAQAPRFEVTDHLLDEARRELRVALRIERTKRSFWSEWMEKLDGLTSPAFRVVAGSIATLVVGVGIGYLVFMPSDGSGGIRSLPGINQASLRRSEPRISNFRVIQQIPETSEVEFSFEMVTPVRMRGNVNDNAVQRVMAQALLGDQNPGSRLMTVSALANQVESTKEPDEEIKGALIHAMKSDGNIGVRREALKAMQKFQLDKDIKDALLFVLKNESNPSMRIDVINYLEKPVLTGKVVDQDILNGLKQSMQSDNNNYIRIRAKNIYEEVNQQ